MIGADSIKGKYIEEKMKVSSIVFFAEKVVAEHKVNQALKVTVAMSVKLVEMAEMGMA